ncbi:DUF7224 domain-containing protein [Streptomyces chumphonensis]|uniref:DUF7224 domain-containing protein n=1 Tax=Streptomyces chumphonensis TaxID=1214925 RepID=UPI003D73B16A
MKTATLLRGSPATYLTAPLLVFCFIVAYDHRASGPITNGYAPATATGAVRLLLFPASIAAGCAAWEAAKMRLSGIGELAPYRSFYSLAANVLWPISVMAASGVAVMNAAFYLQSGVWPGVNSLPTMLTGLLVALCYVIIGFTIGTLAGTPAVVGPLTAAGTWTVIGYTGNLTVDTPALAWLGHVTLYGFTTPEIDQNISPMALLLPLIFLGAVCAACAVLFAPWRARVRRVTAVLLMASGLTISGAVAGSWGYQTPMVESPMAEICRTSSGVQACVPEVWKEDLPVLEAAIRNTVPQLTRAGVNRPEKITYYRFAEKVESNRVWPIGLLVGATQEELSRQVALGPVGNFAEVCDGATADAVEILSMWLLSTSGAHLEPHEHTASSLRELHAVQSSSLEQQKQWYARTIATIHACQENGR